MKWTGVRIAITNQEGEIFAIHELGQTAAEQLHDIVENTRDYVQEEDKDAVKDLLGDLIAAAYNVGRQAVTDANNRIVSEG